MDSNLNRAGLAWLRVEAAQLHHVRTGREDQFWLYTPELARARVRPSLWRAGLLLGLCLRPRPGVRVLSVQTPLRSNTCRRDSEADFASPSAAKQQLRNRPDYC